MKNSQLVNVAVMDNLKVIMIESICKSVITEFNQLITGLTDFKTSLDLRIPINIDGFNKHTADHISDIINTELIDLFEKAGWILRYSTFTENNIGAFLEVRISF